MKNKIIITFLISTTLLLTGCCLSHDFAEATCTTPSTCTKCKKTEGEAIGHTWIDATCEQAKTCSVCNLTDGDPLEHTWLEATTEAPKTCELCGLTEGEPLPTKQGTVEGYEVTEETEETEAENTGGVDVELTEDEYQGDNPYDTGEVKGATTKEERRALAQQIIANHLKEQANQNSGNWDIPEGATPYDPSKDGQYHLGQGGEVPEWAHGDFIN